MTEPVRTTLTIIQLALLAIQLISGYAGAKARRSGDRLGGLILEELSSFLGGASMSLGMVVIFT